MDEQRVPRRTDAETTTTPRPQAARTTNRREFVRRLSSAAAIVSAASASTALSQDRIAAPLQSNRAFDAYRVREQAARDELLLPDPGHPDNGDEARYANKIGSYSKGLPHNALGEVDLRAYGSMIAALQSGQPRDFENIILGLGAKLTNPQAGLAFEMEGPDSHGLMQPPAPSFSSAEEAGEIAENYWMALSRDIPFATYDSASVIRQASQDLSQFSNFKGPKLGGRVTPATLFRGNATGNLSGPFISQFLWLDTPFGSEQVDRKMQCPLPSQDFMTDYAQWLAVQNGAPAGQIRFDPTRRYIRNGRDLSQWVHIDVLFQAYFNAFLILSNLDAPLDAGNPYNQSRTQIGFGTLGGPYMASALCAVARPALKAVWHQKWFVHRRLRPEAFAGRVHNHLTGASRYLINGEIFNSSALDELKRKNGSYYYRWLFPRDRRLIRPMAPGMPRWRARVSRC